MSISRDILKLNQIYMCVFSVKILKLIPRPLAGHSFEGATVISLLFDALGLIFYLFIMFFIILFFSINTVVI